MAEDKFLDDIGDTSAPAAEPAPKADPKPEPVEPEVKAEAEPDERQDPANSPVRPEGYVPRQALEEARREAREHRERAAVLEDRTNKILERYFSQNQPDHATQAEAPPNPGQEPDAGEDPVGWITWRQQRDRFESHQREAYQGQQRQTEQVINAKTEEYNAVRDQFPAIEEARQTVLKGWHRELWLQGFRGAELEQRVANTEAQWVLYAHNKNMPIGEVIAGLAMARGWQPPSDDADPAAANDATRQNAGDVKRDPTTGQFVSETEKAAKIKTSQERNGSLTQVPGAPVEKMTAAELAKLPEEEIWRRFDSVKNSKGKKDFDRRMNFQ